MKYYHQFFLFLLLLLPYSTQAQSAPSDFKGLVQIFLDIIGLLIPVVIALAFIIFLWGIIDAWILGAGNVESVNRGKNIAIIGLIVFVVMLSIWGILGLLQNTLFGG